MTILVSLLLLAAITPRPSASGRSVAVTFDDLPEITAAEDDVATQSDITERLLAAVARQHVPAIGFVNEEKLEDDDDRIDPRRVALLGRWLDDGFELGNHTDSHLSLNASTAAEYEADILKGEEVTRPLITQRGSTLRWFRHPYLETGKSVGVRDEVNHFLAAHGYRVAPVTIDDSEWIYAMAYRKARVWRRPFIRRSYLRYLAERFLWYEERSRLVFGREIPQVLLLHASLLNADAFDSVAAMIRSRGYRFVTIEKATSDPAYASPEHWTAGGVSWIERWGTAKGIPQSRFDGDPHVPLWIQKLAGEKDE